MSGTGCRAVGLLGCRSLPAPGTIARLDDDPEAALKPAQRPLALICLVLCQTALAERSRLADGTDVVERGDCEIEAGYRRHTARGTPAQHESALHVGCGIGWRTELAATFASRRSAGARDAALGVEAKSSLRERGIGRIGWQLVYGLGAERTGEGGRWRHTEQFIAVEATLQPAQAWLIEAKLGTARDRIARRDGTVWALAAEHAIDARVEARAEVGGDDRGTPLLSVGLRYHVWPERALVTLSYGFKASAPHERRIGLGITFEF